MQNHRHDAHAGSAEHGEFEVTRLGVLASRVFTRVENIAYIVLGVLLAIVAAMGIGASSMSLWSALLAHGEQDALVLAVDRLLFVLMVVEILHTVRVSFRSGTLVAEPFLTVGLIASIRRVLVITLETSQAGKPDNWSPQSQGFFNSTMLELVVLGGLILIMVISIAMLRLSRRTQPSG
jgi:uncharacterized membrane protein (DUF373 family)